MTDYTYYKMLKCLLRDPNNISDIQEAIREELKKLYDDVNDLDIDGYGFDENFNYTFEYWLLFDTEMDSGTTTMDLKNVAKLLNTGNI